MANAWYPLYVQAALTGAANVDLTTGTLSASIIDADEHPYDPEDQFFADITPEAVISTTTLGSPAVVGKTLDAANAQFTAVSGAESEAILIWKNTGTPETSRLVLWLDTGITGLPVTPGGGDILVAWCWPVLPLPSCSASTCR